MNVEQRLKLDDLLLPMGESRRTRPSWLRQATPSASPNGVLANLERLRFIRGPGVPHEWARRVHRNRLVQTAREGGNTDAAHLRLFEERRRYATLKVAADSAWRSGPTAAGRPRRRSRTGSGRSDGRGTRSRRKRDR